MLTALPPHRIVADPDGNPEVVFDEGVQFDTRTDDRQACVWALNLGMLDALEDGDAGRANWLRDQLDRYDPAYSRLLPDGVEVTHAR